MPQACCYGPELGPISGKLRFLPARCRVSRDKDSLFGNAVDHRFLLVAEAHRDIKQLRRRGPILSSRCILHHNIVLSCGVQRARLSRRIRIDPNMPGLFGESICLLPAVSRVARNKESKLLIFSSRGVKGVIVSGINCKCLDCAERIWICNHGFIRMIRVHTDGLNRRRLGIDQLPSLARVVAAP